MPRPRGLFKLIENVSSMVEAHGFNSIMAPCCFHLLIRDWVVVLPVPFELSEFVKGRYLYIRSDRILFFVGGTYHVVKKTWSRLLPLPALDLGFRQLWPL